MDDNKRPRKRQRVCDAITVVEAARDATNCFAWLPDELVAHILLHSIEGEPNPFLPSEIEPPSIYRYVCRRVCTRWARCIPNASIIGPTLAIGGAGLMDVAMTAGHIKLIRWFVACHPKIVPRSYQYYRMAYLGRTELLRDWVDACENPEECSKGAGYGGQLSTLEWLLNSGNLYPYPALLEAARGGHFETFKWLAGIGGFFHAGDLRERINPVTVEAAAKGGNVRILGWLQEKSHTSLANKAVVAAKAGQLGALQWFHTLYEARIDWAKCLEKAACRGDVPMLEWLLARTSRRPSSAMSGAIGCGRPAVMQWMHATHGFPLSPMLCAKAALFGDLPTLQWLRANGCGWDKSVVEEAMEFKRYDIVAWAIRNNCPFANTACLRLVMAEYEASLARKNGGTLPDGYSSSVLPLLQR
jgi:hypothetical protein